MRENVVDILLAEDNPNDVRLTLHALRRYNLSNNIHVVRDGAEALDFVFCTGTYVQRDRIDEAVLRDGDEVQIGKYRMVFHPSPRGSGGADAGR